MRNGRAKAWIAVSGIFVVVLVFASLSPAQSLPDESGGTGSGQEEYEDDYGDYGYGDGSARTGDTAGPVTLELRGKKRQRPKVVKLRATCSRACLVELKGSVRTGTKKTKLRGAEEPLAAGETAKFKLRLPKQAKKAARKAFRKDRKAAAKLNGKATGIGGGGKDKEKFKVKLKR